MADVYEQNLAQKSSLTTSDFIRVVGSDNVSYKQQVSNVKDAFGLAVYHIEYAETASTSGTRYYSPSISGAIDSIAAKGAGRYMAECIRSTSYSDSYSNISSANMTLIIDVLGASYINVLGIQLNSSSTGDILIKRAKGPTWGDWIKMPTRAEIDSLNSKSTKIISSTSTSGTFRANTYANNASQFIAMTFGEVYAVYVDWGNNTVNQTILGRAGGTTRGVTFSISDASTHTVAYTATASLWGGMSIIGN